jgi:tetratricopeptide (TPR) repeat protein
MHKRKPTVTGALNSLGGLRAVIICTVLFACSAWCFFPAVHNSFINLDDGDYMTANKHVQGGLTWTGIRWAFSTLDLGSWHPLTWLSIMLDCELYGPQPSRHHLTSILMHAVNTVLCFLVLRRLIGATWRSTFVAALFGLHPLHVESVVWAAERKDVLSGLFFFATLLAYAAYASEEVQSSKFKVQSSLDRQNIRRDKIAISRFTIHVSRWYALSLVLFMCGLMSKPMLVTVPLLLLVVDWWPLRRFQPFEITNQKSQIKKLLFEKLPFFLAALAISFVTIFGQGNIGALEPNAQIPLTFRVANATCSYVWYLVQMIWPANLSVYYAYPQALPLWPAIAAGLAAAFIWAGVLLTARARPYLLFGWLWYSITILPVIGLLQVGGQAHADRYTYLPLVGIFMMIAWGAYDLVAGARVKSAGKVDQELEQKLNSPLRSLRPLREEPIFLGLSSAAVLIGCVVVTQHQISFWKNSETLFRHALAVTRDNHMAHCELGTVLMSQGRIDDAIAEFRESVRLAPRFVLARVSLGVALGTKGQMDAAIEQFRAAVRAGPNDLDAHYNLGVALMSKSRNDEALREFQDVLRIQPGYPRAEANIAVIKSPKPGR